MTIKTFAYTKDDGSTSNRALLELENPPSNLMAYDLSELDSGQRTKVLELRDKYIEEIVKPYKKLEAAFRKENLKGFDKFIVDSGFETPVPIKTFKKSGLVETTE